MNDRKLTPADIEVILDAARYHAELLDRLEQAYEHSDIIQVLIVVREVLGSKKREYRGIKKESIQ